ncbi:MAG: hypothetical protein ACLP36_15820 [Acidimicrobiales bacterium]
MPVPVAGLVAGVGGRRWLPGPVDDIGGRTRRIGDLRQAGRPAPVGDLRQAGRAAPVGDLRQAGRC